MDNMFKQFSVGIVAIGLMAGAVQADSIVNMIEFFEVNTLSDDNRQRHIDRNTSGTLDVGDSIRGVVMIDQFFNPSGPAGGFGLGRDSGNDEVTGIFQIRVASKVAAGPGQFIYTFEPDPDFAAEFGLAVGTMARLWTDSANNMAFDSVTVAASEASATDGTLLIDLGFTGAGGVAGAGEGWSAIGGDDIGALASIFPGEAVGSINLGVSRTSNLGLWGTLPILPLDSINFGSGAEFLGSSSIRGIQGLDTQWEISGDLTLAFIPIPLPAAVWSGLSVLGALGGFNWMRRRRTQLQAA